MTREVVIIEMKRYKLSEIVNINRNVTREVVIREIKSVQTSKRSDGQRKVTREVIVREEEKFERGEIGEIRNGARKMVFF